MDFGIMHDLIDYDKIVSSAMRNVVREVLKKVEKEGLQSDHHFVVHFSTKNKFVVISQHLLEKFPNQMTIIIQHQFRSLKVGEDKFSIVLSFSGSLEKLVIPYNAITSFSDPSVNFSLNFNYYDDEENLDINDEETGQSEINSSEKVISLDDFRKNKNKK